MKFFGRDDLLMDLDALWALLLKERGDDVVGVTMTLGRADEERSAADIDASLKHQGWKWYTCSRFTHMVSKRGGCLW